MKIAWYIYGFLYFSLATYGMYLSFIDNDGVIFTFIGLCCGLFYLYGLYNYIEKKPFWTSSGWRFIFWLIILFSILNILIAGSLYYVYPTQTPITIAFYDSLIGLLLMTPLLYAIYKYSSETNPVWGKTIPGQSLEYLRQLLRQSDTLVASAITEKFEKSDIALTKIENGYSIKLVKIHNENELSFNNDFETLEQVIKFINTNTHFRINDFRINA